jgi:hypothetical protein
VTLGEGKEREKETRISVRMSNEKGTVRERERE